MKTKQAEQKGTYLRAFRAAFPYTVPVLTGYLFIGMAFGVMIQEKGYNFLWAMLMSLCGQRTVSGSQLLRAGRQPFQCDFHGIYGEYPPYFLWIVTVGTFFRDGEKAALHDLFPDG